MNSKQFKMNIKKPLENLDKNQNSNEITAAKQQYNEKRREIELKYQDKLNDLKNKIKSNPQKYVDQTRIDQAKAILDEIIAKEKELMEEIKNDNAYRGENVQIMKKIQMIFQDPISSLNPRMTVREIIAEGLIIAGEKDKAKIDDKVFNVLKNCWIIT